MFVELVKINPDDYFTNKFHKRDFFLTKSKKKSKDITFTDCI